MVDFFGKQPKRLRRWKLKDKGGKNKKRKRNVEEVVEITRWGGALCRRRKATKIQIINHARWWSNANEHMRHTCTLHPPSSFCSKSQINAPIPCNTIDAVGPNRLAHASLQNQCRKQWQNHLVWALDTRAPQLRARHVSAYPSPTFFILFYFIKKLPLK